MDSLEQLKRHLTATYLNTFRYSTEKDKDGKILSELIKSTNYTGSKQDIVSYIKNQAVIGKNKDSARGYALFTSETFYGVDINEKPVQCLLSDISTVRFEKQSAVKKSFFSALITEVFQNGHGVVCCRNNKELHLSKTITEALTAFSVINNLKNTNDRSYQIYQINQHPSMFGEIMAGELRDCFSSQIDQIYCSGAHKFIKYRCKLKKLTLDAAYYEITVKDKDIESDEYPDGLFDEEEWGNAISDFIANPKIRNIYSDSIREQIGLEYTPEQLVFDANIKITLLTRLNNTASTAQLAGEKMMDITVKRMDDARRAYDRAHPVDSKEE